MFYELQVKGHVRVPPTYQGREIKESILEKLNESYEGYISKELGYVICVTEILWVGEGKIIHGDGAGYYETEFKIITYLPELQEIVKGKITDITNFGAFLNIGPVEGMIHISQTMDDFISFGKQKTLTGKESKRVLKIGDICLGRIIAISYKDLNNPKIGLTMRQPSLGAIRWLEEEIGKKKSMQKV